MSRLWWPLCGMYRAFWSGVWRGWREKGRFGFFGRFGLLKRLVDKAERRVLMEEYVRVWP